MRKWIKIFSFVFLLLIALCMRIDSYAQENYATFDECFDTSVLDKCDDLGIEINTLEQIYTDMYLRYPKTIGAIRVASLKKMNDLEGNYYNIIEFNPIGYAIYNQDFSFLLEISGSAASPYKNHNENLLYFGAFNYFIKKHESILVSKYDSIQHCKDNYKINLNDENKRELKSISRDLNINLKNKSNSLKMIKCNSKNKPTANEIRTEWIETGNNYETASVKNTDIIRNADTEGFNDTGNCGFVAGAIIIFYAARAWGWSNLYSKDKIEKNLVENLQGNHSSTSTAPDLEKKLNDYLNSHKSKKNAKVNMWHLPAAHSIFDRVKEDKPVVIFGSLTDFSDSGKCNHAVVVYQVHRKVKKQLFGIKTYSNYEYRTHYGWDMETNDVIISHDSIAIGGMVNLHK